MSKKKSKHIKNKNYKNIVFVIILILIIIIGIKQTNKEQRNEEINLILNNENVTNKLQNKLIKENEKIYMSFEDIQNLIDSTIYKENETNIIITTSSKKVATFKNGEENIEINGAIQKEKDISMEKENREYIAISELENVYDYEFDYIDATNIVTIDDLNKKKVKAYTNKKVKIKEEKNLLSKNIDSVEKGNWLIFISSEDSKMAKVRTQNGKIGYIKEKYLNNFVTEREDFITNYNEEKLNEKNMEYDISKKDISTYEKRKNIINLILQEAIKNGKMYVKIIYNATEEQKYNRFKIEVVTILNECGIKVEF